MSDENTQPEADDVEGHRRGEAMPEAAETDTDDDVEGHRFGAEPGLKTGSLDGDEDAPGMRSMRSMRS